MRENIPKKPDWVVSVSEEEYWPMGLAAYDGGFVILQPIPNLDGEGLASIGRWDFAAFIPGPMARLIGEKAKKE